MFDIRRFFTAAALSLIAGASGSLARADDLMVKSAKKTTDRPFFLVVDDRLTYAWMPKATDPGLFSVQPNGAINGTTAKQVYAFTHFDVWAYGTNFLSLSMFKSDHNDPANPCVTNASGAIVSSVSGLPASCAGMTEIYGLFRSTFSGNDIFNTKAFAIGPLHNISFEVGMDANTENSFLANSKRAAVAGLQFAFDLPYKGYFNVAPLAYWEFSSRNAFAQCGLFGAGVPYPALGATCLADGERSFDVTWSVEANYYMDLGFLPESMQFWSISGRAAWQGPKGYEKNPVVSTPTVVTLNSEPIRLTFDASKALWGPRYAHFVDLWVAYRYWQNKFGLDHNRSASCLFKGTSNNSCTEETVYAGVTMKF
ncbi:hypothetical protein [Bradyrhizobium betae]|uniref:Porin n=1 Tax=Bradyrhizobium betae TaxID=244734 RepID=A0A4Q1V6Q7_9BRAD|nr:hypothetical protein [Bradyrhizobium betae]RXT45627.1 hypothetical protein B5V03_18280 [Bradyrhizobium betae]